MYGSSHNNRSWDICSEHTKFFYIIIWDTEPCMINHTHKINISPTYFALRNHDNICEVKFCELKIQMTSINKPYLNFTTYIVGPISWSVEHSCPNPVESCNWIDRPEQLSKPNFDILKMVTETDEFSIWKTRISPVGNVLSIKSHNFLPFKHM